jgi:hypothetical protein
MAFNVNAARAQRLAARGEVWPFELDGTTYELPNELDESHLDALKESDGGAIATLRILLGDAVHAELKANHKLTIADYAAILDAYNKDNAITVGEDSGSSDS